MPGKIGTIKAGESGLFNHIGLTISTSRDSINCSLQNLVKKVGYNEKIFKQRGENTAKNQCG